MGRRGFFAELQHQARVAAREEERRDRQATREHAALVRRVEQARKAEERAKTQLAKSAEVEGKRLEKEAKEAHLEAMQAQVEERNAELAEIYDDIDSLLASTLSRDDYVDLKTLHVVAQHPPFDPGDLAAPIPQPTGIRDPSKPVLVRPDPPRAWQSCSGKRNTRKLLRVLSARTSTISRSGVPNVSTRKHFARRQGKSMRRMR